MIKQISIIVFFPNIVCQKIMAIKSWPNFQKSFFQIIIFKTSITLKMYYCLIKERLVDYYRVTICTALLLAKY